MRVLLNNLTQRHVHQLARLVSTWSPLTSTFNSKPSAKINFSLPKTSTGLFCFPQLRDHTGFYLLQDDVKMFVEELVAEATSPNRTRKIVEVFDELSDCLCRIADMADFVRVSHPESNYAHAAGNVCLSLSELVEQLNTNVELHRSLKNVLQNGDVVPVDDIDRRVTELFMFDFEQSGIHLPDEQRKRFVQLNDGILKLGSYFVQGTQQPSSVARDKIPEHLWRCFSNRGNQITVNGLYSDHFNDLVREAAYKIYLYPDSHQIDLLEGLLQCRHQLANLVGFPTYAHRALKGTTAETPENVMSFLESLADLVRDKAKLEYDEMKQLKIQNSFTGSLSQDIQPWDPPYYTAYTRHLKCEYNTSDVSPYFSLGCCMEGLSNLFHKLYDVTLHNVEVQPGEIWHYDIRKIAVMHSTEGVMGYIYCDFFERPGKPNQDCHFTIQGGRQKADGSYQCPIVVLQLNFTPPSSSAPSLLTPGMMENLFHEFGHAMHSMLGRTKYQHVTGTRCPTDFAEVPSVLMEYFAWDPRVISSYARHFNTGEPLPKETIDRLCEAKKLFVASDTQVQVFNSMLDQVYHGAPTGKSTTEVLKEVQTKYYGIPYVENTAWQMRFGHLVGYGAKYYSYLLSRAIASRIWHKCFKDDPFSSVMGKRYKEKMLAHGGGKHPTELIEDMLNETPTMDKLVTSLMDEID